MASLAGSGAIQAVPLAEAIQYRRLEVSRFDGGVPPPGSDPVTVEEAQATLQAIAGEFIGIEDRSQEIPAEWREPALDWMQHL